MGTEASVNIVTGCIKVVDTFRFLRDNRFGTQVWKTYNDIVRACATAWNWFVSDPARITSIGTREWVIL